MSVFCCDSNKKCKKHKDLDNIKNNDNKYKENQNLNQDTDKVLKNNMQKQNKLYETPEKEYCSVNGIVGLANLGFTCYFNSALQNLKNIYPFTLYLLKNYKNFKESGFTYKYCKLIANLIGQTKNKYFEPIEFFDYFQKLAPNFRIYEQNDSCICIMYIFKYLEKEAKIQGEPNPDIIDSLNEEETKKFKNFISNSFSGRNSYILDYFYGFQQEIFKCRKCQDTNINFQGFNVLNLPIAITDTQRISKLEDAFKYYQLWRTHKDKENFYCSACKERDTMNRSLIISYPKILIINFKRIGEEYFYNHDVEIPPKLILDKYKYELIGFIEHIGGSKSGHNIALCKNFFDDKWYEYNDDEVRRVECFNIKNEEEKLVTKNGFLFFYKKLGIYENIETKDGKNIIIDASFSLMQ